ncbi:MAG: hypothetical protein OXE95_01550 [Chloroflexi bacterium]|nr:hypothetical protein [Chloroflexota bacterium]MCY4246245.1 hypothetical protein [Chloroflexota bacterium]
MFSWRVWQALAQPDRDDPLVRRLSQLDRPTSRQGSAWLAPSKLLGLLVFFGLGSLFLAPQLLMVFFTLPVVLLALLVLSPLLLPAVAPLLGLLLTGEILAGLARERLWHTWPLLCALPGGALRANWSCAIGLAQRGNWLLPLRFLARLTLWLGMALWLLLALLSLWLAFSNQQAPGGEQARLLLVLGLGLVVYYAQLAQTLAVAVVCGLWPSAFNWQRRDVAFAGLGLYLALAVLPLLLGLWMTSQGWWLAGLGLALMLRECAAWLLWRHLRWRLGE